MPLLDGKFEIIREHQLAPGQTHFDAAAPDGAAVHIVWFDVPASLERSFEEYRRTLKKLAREGHAALYDVVSRPGAHYVVWHSRAGARLAPPGPELQAALDAAGIKSTDADIRRSANRQTQVYGLQWTGAPVTAAVPPPPRQQAVRRKRPARRLSQAAVTNTLAGFILVLAAGILLTSFLMRSNATTVTMPDVTGQDVTEVVPLLSGMGLDPQPLAEASDLPPGTVLRATLAPGMRADRGSFVQLVYAFPSDQAQPAVVPDLVGRSYPGQVQGPLNLAGLRIGNVSRVNSTASPGTVLAQSQPAGSTIASDQAVSLLVSAGESLPVVTLDDLSGLTLAEATAQAVAAGVPAEQITTEETDHPLVQPGLVVRQLPEPGAPVTLAPEGTVLTLSVAAGPANAVELPDFTGLSRTEATVLASRYQLTVREVSDSSLPEGVVSQEPQPGSWVDGGPLLLVVNVRPTPIPALAPEAEVRQPGARSLAYDWYIEPGIGEQTARVFAVSLEGEEQLVAQKQVRGGERVQGTFDTEYAGIITFRLTLNNEPYGGLQRAR